MLCLSCPLNYLLNTDGFVVAFTPFMKKHLGVWFCSYCSVQKGLEGKVKIHPKYTSPVLPLSRCLPGCAAMENSNGPDPQARPKAATLQLTNPLPGNHCTKTCPHTLLPISIPIETHLGWEKLIPGDGAAAPQGICAETIAVSGLQLFKSYHLLAENR